MRYVNYFKIGDKIKVNKLSEPEFEELYIKKNKWNWTYSDYLNFYNSHLNNKIFIIEDIYMNRIFLKNSDFIVYKEEVEKVN